MSDEPKAPPKAKQKRARRSYADDYRDLQSRVEMALRLLRRAAASPSAVNPAESTMPLIDVAIETLEGK